MSLQLLSPCRMVPVSCHQSLSFVDVHFWGDPLLRDEDSEIIEDVRRRLGRFLLRSLESELEALESELSDELDSDSDSESELSEEDLEDLFAMDDQLTSIQDVKS